MYIVVIKNNYSYRFYYCEQNGKWTLKVHVSKDWLFGKIVLLEIRDEEIINYSFHCSELKKQLLIIDKYNSFLLGI